MRVVLLTTRDNPMGGIFAAAYHAAGGPPLERVVVVPSKLDSRFPWWKKPLVALQLLGIRGGWGASRGEGRRRVEGFNWAWRESGTDF